MPVQLTPSMRRLIQEIAKGNTSGKELALALGISEMGVRIGLMRLYARLRIEGPGYQMPKLVQWIQSHPQVLKKEE